MDKNHKKQKMNNALVFAKQLIQWGVIWKNI